MKKIILFTMSALMSAASFAQSLYPERGLYKLMSLEADYKIDFVSPTKMTLEYKEEKTGRIKETWIRYNIPEPLSSLLSNFRE